MKILEIIFLIFTIVVPGFFLFVILLNFKKVKKKPKYRKKLLRFFILSLLINGCIYGGIKVFNDTHLKESETQKETEKSSGESKTEEKDKPKEKVESVTPKEEPSKEVTEGNKNNNENKSETDSTNNKNQNSTNATNSNQGSSVTNNNTNSQATTVGTTSKGYKIQEIDGVTYIDGLIIANKTYKLPESFVPKNTYKSATGSICQECIDKTAYSAYTTMRSDASKNGLSIWIASGYRSYSYQGGLYNSYVNRSGKEAADTYSARAGHSEHQTGLAFDLNTVEDSFANTKEGIWVNENCYKYGFIIRYPKDKSNETGYKYEPWHLRYVGKDLASKLYNGGDWITLEDYFGITSEYAE